MSGPSIFPVKAIRRDLVRWEDELRALTPITAGERVLYKREDAFAPLGYGGINGSKLRQLIYLVDRYRDGNDGAGEGIITGASVLSPQVSMSALVARHFRLPITIVLGGTTPASSLRHENVAIAAEAGADFAYVPVGYNPALQRGVVELAKRPFHAGWYRLHYGITTPDRADPEEVEAFHAVGAPQVRNIGADVRTLVMTAGSCNSCVSVLYGLALWPPPNLERVVLIGVGPSRVQWMEDRLRAIETAIGEDVLGRFPIERHDLHTSKFAAYGDRMPWLQDGIDFHPTYEGKMMTWLDLHRAELPWWRDAAGDVLVWIVGSRPTRAAMAEALAA